MANFIVNLLFVGFILNNHNMHSRQKINKTRKIYISKNTTNINHNKSKTLIDDFIDSKIAMGAYPLAFNFKKF